jgi:outer membrane protein assembly factor BamB
MYLHDTAHSSSNPNDTAISLANVSEISLSWTKLIVSKVLKPIATAIATSPTVVGNVEYIGAWDGNFTAVYANNGTTIWHDYLGQTNATNSPKCIKVPRGVTSAATVLNGVVYVSGGADYTYALNASTGAQIWSAYVGDNDKGNYNWASPMIYGDYEYLGVASDCDSPLVRGALLQINIHTGTVVNTFYTIPSGFVGGSIWTTPVFDVPQNEIIISTGNCNGNNYNESPYCGGLVALNMSNISLGSCTGTTYSSCDTSKVLGYWQDKGCDATTPDCDLAVSPTLFTTTTGTEMVSTGGKDGIVYAFKANDIQPSGAVVWDTSKNKVAFGGDIEAGKGLAATGVWTGKYLVYAGQKTANKSYAGSITALNPDNGTWAWSTPLPNGMTTWGATTYENGLIIEGAGSLTNYSGQLFLLNADTGKIVWSTWTQGLFYGPVSVAQGHIYGGDYNGNLYSWGLPSGSLQIASFTSGPSMIPLSSSTTFYTNVTGGTAPYTYSYTGLPAGCSSQNLSQLPCTPTAVGTFTVTVKVTDMNGSSATAQTTLTVSPTYAVTFSETGLPTGTTWSVTLNGQTKSGNGLTIVFNVANSTYPYSVGALSGYTPNPSSGNVTVAGAPISLTIGWSASTTYAVTFTEAGLPGGTNWSVTLNGVTNSSTSTMVNFFELPGNYSYTIAHVTGYTTPSYTGTVQVTTGRATVRVPWSAIAYNVTFQESGLPSGTTWGITLNHTTMNSTTSTVVFAVPNGLYGYQVLTVAGYAPSPPNGTLTVSGTNLTESIAFSVLTTYAVTFSETGLPSGSTWSVTLGAVRNSSSGPQIGFEEPNGTYGFSVSSAAGYRPTPGSGNIVVQGAGVEELVQFGPPARFALSVVETGLPNGKNWSVTFSGLVVYSTGTSAGTDLPNGTYSVFVNPVPGFRVNASSFQAVVAGRPVTFDVAFTPYVFTVTFTETGLSSGQSWSVTLNGSARSSITSTVVFSVGNGSYNFSIGSVSGYSSSPSSGTVPVEGKNVSQSIQFSTTSTSSNGLTPTEEAVIGAVIVAAIAATVIVLALRRKKRSPPTENPPIQPWQEGK